jgi:hypothetical protein
VFGCKTGKLQEFEVRHRLIGILQEVEPLAYFPPKLTWMNASHRNSRGFDRINSCVPKTLTRKILAEIESYEIPMFFLHFKGGLNDCSTQQCVARYGTGDIYRSHADHRPDHQLIT